jgi:hypothetical protein
MVADTPVAYQMFTVRWRSVHAMLCAVFKYDYFQHNVYLMTGKEQYDSCIFDGVKIGGEDAGVGPGYKFKLTGGPGPNT